MIFHPFYISVPEITSHFPSNKSSIFFWYNVQSGCHCRRFFEFPCIVGYPGVLFHQISQLPYRYLVQSVPGVSPRSCTTLITSWFLMKLGFFILNGRIFFSMKIDPFYSSLFIQDFTVFSVLWPSLNSVFACVFFVFVQLFSSQSPIAISRCWPSVKVFLVLFP